jgi:hypothetical protein
MEKTPSSRTTNWRERRRLPSRLRAQGAGLEAAGGHSPSFGRHRGSHKSTDEACERGGHGGLEAQATSRSAATLGRTTRALPPLPLADWEDTKETLHRYCQIAGKVRMEYSPYRNRWWHITLFVTFWSSGVVRAYFLYRLLANSLAYITCSKRTLSAASPSTARKRSAGFLVIGDRDGTTTPWPRASS